MATAGGVVLSVTAMAAAGVLLANNTGGGGHRNLPTAAQGDGTQQVVTDPWWDAWTTDRYDGPAATSSG